MANPLPKNAVVAVIGAGAMGAGIAQIAALHGHPVQLHDVRFGAGDEACRTIRKNFDRRIAKGQLSGADADAALKRISTVVTLPDTCVAGLVIEAIVEELDAKRELFESLVHVVADDCILASNTSAVSITALASGIRNPGRVIGMHFFNPVPAMPLVEIVSGALTDRGVADVVFATAQAWGKMPVHALSTPGFIVNRCARPFYGEALRLLAERAADPPTIDAVMREAGGFRMGPFELMDLIGHDVNFAVTESVWKASFHDSRYTPSGLQRELVAAGFLGRKSGRGFYRYGKDVTPPAANTEPERTKPSRVTVHGESALFAPLLARLERANMPIERAPIEPGLGAFALRASEAEGDAWLALADGRTATARAIASGLRNLVAFDLALDYGTATRLAVARSDTCSDIAFGAAIGVLQSAGFAVSRFDDVAGLAVMRTVAMLANEAADAVLQGVADAAAVDLAMAKGVNFPRGPLEWADAIGAGMVRSVLLHLAAHYGEDRYRLSTLIARRALTGKPLRA